MTDFTGTDDDFRRLINELPACLVYCSTNNCSVCTALKPKIDELIRNEFPQIKLISLLLNQYPEIAGQYHVFAAPTILVFFNGQEFIRKTRSFGVNELKSELLRPYQLLFS